MNNLSFYEAIKLATSTIRRFEKIEGKPWRAEGGAMELTKQVGELCKLIMSYEGYYFPDRIKNDKKYESSKDKIGDELADIFFTIIRIADYYNIDLEKSHLIARQGEDVLLTSKGV